ncbi:MAG TPA: winged helix-turn-helix domain-containing protein, partial [Terriglobales bacterium]|nr:winged helix-turn-helix domain-containing protein [Terriglobales bacterium]
MESNDSQSLVGFGPYEVDLRTQEIRKHGNLIRLVGQPFQILEMLLAHPGELITRDELQQRLWPGESLVDCTHGLNAAVNKLREALGDSAITPLYVETLPRRGYRFIGTLRPHSSEAQETVIASSLPPEAQFATSVSPNPDSASTVNTRPTPPPTPVLSRQWTIALASVVALVIGGLGGMALSPRFHISEEKQTTSLASRELAALEEKEQSERQATTPRSSGHNSPRVVGALTRPAILREPALNSPPKDPTLRTVVSGSGSAGPQFSPDGKHIAFMSNRTGPW